MFFLLVQVHSFAYEYHLNSLCYEVTDIHGFQKNSSSDLKMENHGGTTNNMPLSFIPSVIRFYWLFLSVKGTVHPKCLQILLMF